MARTRRFSEVTVTRVTPEIAAQMTRDRAARYVAGTAWAENFAAPRLSAAAAYAPTRVAELRAAKARNRRRA